MKRFYSLNQAEYNYLVTRMAILRGIAWFRGQSQRLWRSSQSSSETIPGSMTVNKKLVTHSYGFQNCCRPAVCFPFCPFVKGSIYFSYSVLSNHCVWCIWWQPFVSLTVFRLTATIHEEPNPGKHSTTVPGPDSDHKILESEPDDTMGQKCWKCWELVGEAWI